MNDYSFTVGIPFYIKSNPHQFKEAIDSVLNQTLLPKKIHLIQDGPINNSIKRVLDQYKSHKSNLFILLKLKKCGLPRALNESIKSCNTKFYARMDADDICFPDRFEKQISYFKNHLNTEILGTWAYEFENELTINRMFLNRTPLNKIDIKNIIHYRNPLIHSSVMFKVDSIVKVGMYNEYMYTDQDLELWNRCINDNIVISNIQEPLIYLRVIDRLKRRSKWSAIKRQIIIRYSHNTSSLKLNFLKLASIVIRIMPFFIRKWAYKNLRK
ncbi:MAG: hypothetical protein CBD26_03010 [Candidatus Pelagibacter sp. TMED166]|nr:MAG: hypothetical protein CBD26_03010 [Candidatus Pelagibacter sp. TMED166]|tara:strand:+ start:29648 stop:30457 length:810 start_codon:yes stop_codon:yes gene_type:complete